MTARRADATDSVDDLVEDHAPDHAPDHADVADAALRAELAALAERPLEPAEFDRRLAAAIADDAQMAKNLELIEWFMRRYPTPRDRLAAVRRRTRAWLRPTRRKA